MTTVGGRKWGGLCLGERDGESREKVGYDKALPFEETMWMSTDLG